MPGFHLTFCSEFLHIFPSRWTGYLLQTPDARVKLLSLPADICKVSGSTWKRVFSSKERFCIKRSATSSSRKPSLVAQAQLRALLAFFGKCPVHISGLALVTVLLKSAAYRIDSLGSGTVIFSSLWWVPSYVPFIEALLCATCTFPSLHWTGSIVRPNLGLWRDLHHAPVSEFSHL